MKKIGIGLISGGGSVAIPVNLFFMTPTRISELILSDSESSSLLEERSFIRAEVENVPLSYDIDFPALINPLFGIDLIIHHIKSYFEIFNVEVTTSLSELESMNADRKVAVFFVDPSFVDPSNTNTTDPAYNHYIVPNFYPYTPPRDDNEDYLNATFGFYIVDPSAALNPGQSSAIQVVVVGTKLPFVSPEKTFGEDENDLIYYNEVIFAEQNPASLISTAVHEVGHALGLRHHGEITLVYSQPQDGRSEEEREYTTGNNCWVPIMGQSNTGLEVEYGQVCQWNNGGYPNATRPNQDDIFIISRSGSLIKLSDNHPSFRKQRAVWENIEWDKIEDESIKLQNEDKKIITKKVKLVNASDIKESYGIKSIEGMIGFPGDHDLLKIILKKGTYTIGERGTRVFGSIAYSKNVGLKIIESHSEVSKQTKKIEEIKKIPKAGDQEFECGTGDAFVKQYPENGKYGCSAIILPEYSLYSREIASVCGVEAVVASSDVITDGEFNENRPIVITLSKTSLVYLKVYGDETGLDLETTNTPANYGCVGKYNIIIRNEDDNTFDLNLILPEKAPPNAYATEKIKCILNGVEEDTIFFTQDPSDYSSNEPYDGNSDNANSRKFNIVINGKLIEIPILLQGKPYSLDEEIENKEDKELFYISYKDADSNEIKISQQEFVMAPLWDYIRY